MVMPYSAQSFEITVSHGLLIRVCVQEFEYMVQELMPNGDLFSALADEELAQHLSWYCRYSLALSIIPSM